MTHFCPSPWNLALMGLNPKLYLVLRCKDGWEEGGRGFALSRGSTSTSPQRMVKQEGSDRWFPHLLCRLEPAPATVQKAPVPAPLGPGLRVHCSVEAGTGAGPRRISRISTGSDWQTPLGQKQQQQQRGRGRPPGAVWETLSCPVGLQWTLGKTQGPRVVFFVLIYLIN